MLNFIKNLFRSKKQEPETAIDDCMCGHCDSNIGSEAAVTVPTEPKQLPKGKRKRASSPKNWPNGKRRKPSGKMSAKNTYNESVSPSVGQNTSGDFATSMIVAQATDNAGLGMLVGGDPLGAIIGASLADHGETHHIQHTEFSADSAVSFDTTTHYHDHTPSYDSSPSSDNSSYSDSTSYDSSSSSGGGDW
jgi:hypothetical protein